ncbi:MAG: ZIP family metal transporter [Flavobacteriales bacterium]|jgi:zinc transporter ZupT
MNPLTMVLVLLLVVVAGGGFVHLLQANNKAQFIKLSLAFSGGFLLAIVFEHLLPELYAGGTSNIGIYILIGFLIQLIMEYFSGGIEHGHVHVHKGQAMPWALFISLSIHSIIEGIPLGNDVEHLHHLHDHDHKMSLFWGIVFHQIPVAIALMTLLLSTSLSKRMAWIVLLLFGIMTPMGLFIGLKVPMENTGISVPVILGIVIGMFLHISTTIIFETSENHKFNVLKLSSVIAGMVGALWMY